MKQTYKIAILTPVDQRNLEPGELFSGLFGLKLDGVSYLNIDEAINALNTPPFKKGFETRRILYYIQDFHTGSMKFNKLGREKAMSISIKAQALFEDAFQAQEAIFSYLEALNKQGIYILNHGHTQQLKNIITNANHHYDVLHDYLINDAASITLSGPIFPIANDMEHIEYIISNSRQSIRETNRIVTRDFFRL